MDANLHPTCPVCGKPAGPEDTSKCPGCGFEPAFPVYFASEISRTEWLARIEAAKRNHNSTRAQYYSKPGCFIAGSNAVALLHPTTHTLYIVRGTGELLTEKNVLQYSASERNHAVLYDNGTVKVFGGDNSYGQKNTAQWKDVAAILCAPNCTYGVTRSGSVLVQGSPADPAIRGWTNVSALACGASFVVALRKDGTLLCGGTLPDPTMGRTLSELRNVTLVTASRDCVLALQASGSVRFVGKAGDPRKEASGWQNIRTLCADSAYALGLTTAGKLHFAGFCKPFLDRGRSAASKWDDLMAISCAPSGIAGLTTSGELRLAGSFSGDLTEMIRLWKDRVTPGIT